MVSATTNEQFEQALQGLDSLNVGVVLSSLRALRLASSSESTAKICACLLRKLAPRLSQLCQESEIEKLFDEFFIPSSTRVSEISCSAANIAIVLCELSQSLKWLVEIDNNTRAAVLNVVLRLIKKLLLVSDIETLIGGRSALSSMEINAFNELQKASIQCLSSLPDYVANCTGVDLPEFFKPATYFRRLAQQAVDAVKTQAEQLSNRSNRDNDRSLLMAISHLLGKMIRLGHAGYISNAILVFMSATDLGKQKSKTTMDIMAISVDQVQFALSLSIVLGHLDISILDQLVHQVLIHIQTQLLQTSIKDVSLAVSFAQKLLLLLSPSLFVDKLRRKEFDTYTLQGSHIYFLIVEQALLYRVYRSSTIITVLVTFLYLYERQSVSTAVVPTQVTIQSAFHALLLCWSEPFFTRDRNFEQQKYLTYALVCCLGFLSKDVLTQNSNNNVHSSLALNAVTQFMECTTPSVRTLGMTAAECMAPMIHQDSKLDFELDYQDELVCLTRQHFATGAAVQKYQYKLESQPQGLLSIQLDVLDPANSTTTTPVNPLNSSSSTTTLHPPVTWIDSDDEDDNLVPYNIPDEQIVDDMGDAQNDQQQKRPPVYIRQCIDLLKDTDDVDKIELVLQNIETVIARASDIELKECGADLCRRLLYLEDKFTLSVYPCRLKSLTAIYVRLPRIAGGYLGNQFYSRNLNIAQRIDILQTVSASVQILSSVQSNSSNNTHVPTPSTTAKNISLQSSFERIKQATVTGKTRWYSSKLTSKTPSIVKNKLSGIAGWFFYPFLAPWENAMQYRQPSPSLMNISSIHEYGNHNASMAVSFVQSVQTEHLLLLEHLVIAMSVVVYHTANISEHYQMAHDLWLFSWSLRHHTSVKVRSAVLFAFMSVFETVDESVLIRNMNTDVFLLGDWISDIYKEDRSDKDTWTFASFLMMRIESMAKRQQETLLSV